MAKRRNTKSDGSLDESLPDESLRFSVTAVQYAEDVLSGKVPACRWIKLAAERFIDDLHWQDDENFQFYYDAEAAEKACRFIEKCPHTKGKWAKEGRRLELEPWQIFFVCNAFGWMRKKDNTRRFRRVVLIVPRKNGKSALAAAIGLYMLCADGEHGAEVYSGATNEKQAWEVFGPGRLMAMKQKAMRDHYGVSVNAKNLSILSNGSKFEPVIGEPGDGASPSLGIVDEYHEHKTSAQFDTFETGMLARDQPMMLVITTAGDNIAGPCYALQERAQSMLEGTRAADDMFALIYTVDPDDDWRKESVLRKANPNFGVSAGADGLRMRQQEALVSPRDQATFKTKHLNIWVQSRQAYFNVQQWKDAKEESAKPQDFIGWNAVLAMDLGEKRDLTAVEIVFQEPDVEKPRYAGFSKFYCPAETIEPPHIAGSSKKTPEMGITDMLQEWRETGLLRETPGRVTDKRIIRDDILDLAAEFGITRVIFDPWRSSQMALELSEQGLTCVEFKFSPSNTNEPMRELDALIADGRFIHNGDVAFTWMLGNVVNGARRGSYDLHRPDKEKPENKIDGPVARIMAIGDLINAEDDDSPLEIGADYSAGG